MSYNSLFCHVLVCVLCLRALSAIDWPIREVHLSTSEAHSVCKQAVWLIIRPVQFTLWWSNFSSLKNIQDSHTGTSPLSWGSVPLCSAVSHEISMATRQDMEWHEYNGDLWNCYYNQTKQNKTNQYKHAQLAYCKNRVNYILLFIWARNRWVHSKKFSVDVKNTKCHYFLRF